MHHHHLGDVRLDRRHRARRILVAALGATAAATIGLAVPAAATPPAPATPLVAPQRVAGDRHSDEVRAAASAAVDARDVYAWTKSPDALAAYSASLDRTAVAVAAEFAVDPSVVRTAWSSADFEHQTATLAALSQIGTAYRYATSEPNVGFDCSGLTSYAWRRAGFSLTNQSSAQINAAAGLDRTSARAGDLVQYPGHVMMYLGFGDAIVHAANSENDVELSTLRSGRSFRWGDPTG